MGGLCCECAGGDGVLKSLQLTKRKSINRLGTAYL